MSYPPIEDLVPHGLPIRAVEELQKWAPGQATCSLRVRPHGLFVKNGKVPTASAIEYIGQAIAACLGYEAYKNGNNVRVGMIVGVRKLDVFCPSLSVGSVVRIEVERLRGDEDLSVFSGKLFCADELASQATLTVVHPERPPD